MKRFILSIICTLAVTGCVTAEQRQANRINLENRLMEARPNSKVICPDKPSCEKAFSLAKIFVQDYSDMKIQHSDETMVSTYNPFDNGYVGLSATKIPSTGDSAVIQLGVVCKGMDGSGSYFDSMCMDRVILSYNAFGPTIATLIKPLPTVNHAEKSSQNFSNTEPQKNPDNDKKELGEELYILGKVKAARFPHKRHQDIKIGCEECHVGNLSKMMASDKETAHSTCVKCHREKSIGIKCLSCHF